MSQAENELRLLRQNISTFADELKKNEQRAVRLVEKYETPSNKRSAEDERDTYRRVQNLLHIWTGGEFGTSDDNAAVSS
ncbi:hypothetical protein [Amycolatopsis rubida]|uniref:Uncharacterized protein n=1 Tax=Amycolatopsis rubida TaxID=112413 RepID=A0A1I5IJQ2_9PSEU|nr:hypothetical protein [Amycolatopsis rubida]SFO60672.1 hypothetical protein SAMN05421854_102508 [Amycolatopsis rubida]